MPYAKKKSHPPEVPDSKSTIPPFLRFKDLCSIGGWFGSGATGVSGVVGICNKWSSSQWTEWIGVVKVYIIVYAILFILIYVIPYLYKLYLIKKEYANDTPAEREKEREYDIKIKEMEYRHKEHMKELEMQKQNIPDLKNRITLDKTTDKNS